MTIIQRMPLVLAQEALAVAKPFTAGRKENSPVLQCVRLTAGEIVATDRYAAARYRSDLITGDDAPILLPSEAVAWVTAIKRSTLRNIGARQASFHTHAEYANDPYTLMVEETPSDSGSTSDVTVTIGIDGKVERSQVFDGIVGNYPPIERLIPETFPEQERLMPHLAAWQLKRLGEVARIFADDAPVLIRPAAESDGRKMDTLAWRIHGTPVDGIVASTLVKDG